MMKKLMNVLIVLMASTLVAQNLPNTSYHPEDTIGRRFQQTVDGGRIEVGTTKEYPGKGQQILLTKTNKEGNEEWFQLYGGRSYDKASSVRITADGGYVIIGSTSSYGAGNYDVFLIKTDANGKKQWSKTFGEFYNDHRYYVAQAPDLGYIIKGKTQSCDSNTDFQSCIERTWIIKTDATGTEVWEQTFME